MENISAEGVRIIGKVNNQSTGVKVFVGVKVGGLRDPADATKAEPSARPLASIESSNRNDAAR